MGFHTITEKDLERLNELSDLQHPHLAGDNHTRKLVEKVYNGEKLNASEAFDCGKYYQRMLNDLPQFRNDGDLYGEYLNAILAFKWNIK